MDGRRGFLGKLLGLVILPRWVSKILPATPSAKEEWVTVHEVWDTKTGRHWRQVGMAPWEELARRDLPLYHLSGPLKGGASSGDLFDISSIQRINITDTGWMKCGWTGKRSELKK